MTSPQAPDGSGDQESPEPASPHPSAPTTADAGEVDRSGGDAVAGDTAMGGEDAPDREPADEHDAEPPPTRPATGIRWSDDDRPAPADDDATPPAGFHTPPTGPPTAPAWAPAPPPAAPPRDPARRRRIRRVVVLAVLALLVVAAVVVLLLAFLVGPRFARYDVLDRAAVERGVTDVVTRDWHRRITGVTCPDGERVRPGTSFTCSATVDGRPQQVPVDVVDEHGTYEVGQPR